MPSSELVGLGLAAGSWRPEEVLLQRALDDFRVDIHAACPPLFREIIQRCCSREAGDRPSASWVVERTAAPPQEGGSLV